MNNHEFNKSKYLATNLFSDRKYSILKPTKTTPKLATAKFGETLENLRYTLFQQADAIEEMFCSDE
jgi:hypothetical protein